MCLFRQVYFVEISLHATEISLSTCILKMYLIYANLTSLKNLLHHLFRFCLQKSSHNLYLIDSRNNLHIISHRLLLALAVTMSQKEMLLDIMYDTRPVLSFRCVMCLYQLLLMSVIIMCCRHV